MVKVLVIYDISDDRHRAKLAEELEMLGLARIQRSAFIGVVNQYKLKDIEKAVKIWARGEDDIVHIIPLCENDYRKMKVHGTPWYLKRSRRMRGVLIV